MAPMIVRPPLPFVPGLAVDMLALPGLAFLPPRLREEFRIDWGEPQALAARAADYAIRAWTKVTPAAVRSMPQAREAFARAAAVRLTEA